MLSPTDVSECQLLVTRIRGLLKENEIMDIVPHRLYLTKNGDWHVRCMMSGYSLGQKSIEQLLPHFVTARVGFEITPEQAERDGPLIIGCLSECLGDALQNLANIIREEQTSAA